MAVLSPVPCGPPGRPLPEPPLSVAVRDGTGLAKNQGECRASGLVPGDTCLIRHLAGRHAKFNEKNIHDHKPYPQCEALVYRIVWDASWTPDWSLLSECQKGKAKKRAFSLFHW